MPEDDIAEAARKLNESIAQAPDALGWLADIARNLGYHDAAIRLRAAVRVIESDYPKGIACPCCGMELV